MHGGVHAAQLGYAGNDGIAGELVIQEGAQTYAQRTGHLLQGADGGIYLVIFHAFQKIDGQSRILGQGLKVHVPFLAERADALSDTAFSGHVCLLLQPVQKNQG